MNSRSGLLLKKIPDDNQKHSLIQDTQNVAVKDEKEDQNIRCRLCGHVITRVSERLIVQGRHRHVFANPYGLVFDTACFKRAKGCVVTGTSSDEFTWFPGHRWRIAICGACLNHLGWQFILKGDTFFCLITDNLLFP